ncbi:hypothetical protein QJQ45_018576 [Haematococcus lacustris]|nr:hypothetical protein QJQ45_018576 [Haematococcus lacustris]
MELHDNWRRVASTHDLRTLLEDTRHDAAFAPTPKLRVQGAALLLLGICVFVSSTWALLVSKLLPGFQPGWLRWLQDDWYYCLLLPLLLPTGAFFTGLRWFSLKLYKHNS